MKRENDELTDFFRSHLMDAEAPTREGFWDDLNQELASRQHRRLLYTRLIGAASVLLVLAASSAAFLYLSPHEEIEEAFMQVAVGNSGVIHGDGVRQLAQPILATPADPQPVVQSPVRLVSSLDQPEDSASLTVSVSVHIAVNTTVQRHVDTIKEPNHELWKVGTANTQTDTFTEQDSPTTVLTASAKARKWGLKLGVGTAIPASAGVSRIPIVGKATVVHQFNSHLSLEAGVQYTNLDAETTTLHHIGIPVQLNVSFAQTKKAIFYALVGGMADKCIAGSTTHTVKDESVQWAVTGGLGCEYKVNDRIALFAEPSVSHHFRTVSNPRTVRTERPTNVNLICGLRMTY